MPFLVRRALQAVVVLAAAFTGAFVLMQALPGDAILIKFENPELGLSAAQIAEIRAAYGADSTPIEQFLHTLAGFLAGDFGYSIQYGTAVHELIGEALPGTALLAGLGFAAAVVLAVAIAFLSTLAPFAWLGQAIRALPGLFVSVPVFWLGIVLIQVFSFQLKLVPLIGASGPEALVLPVLTLAVPIAAPIAQVLVRAIDEASLSPFVAVARAKGAGPARVLVRDVARNAALPALTISGVLVGELIGGAVVTETVFGRAGIGRLTEQAVSNQDVPVLQAVVVLAAVVFVVVSLAVDLVAPLIDPRLTRKAVAA
ncbi:ABC transporter permease [Agromyces archimandritae]|uniref:ABC transporter permease n=1 Tax=Agromyces archimandritae TaxID=2781962 RepID=A0A975IMM3_9MICO|nr:ABC transporter permease [Agromyces archimandritae]QTX03667.1 ABC transporter permease [Agromyces archimandritae]